LQPVSWLDWLVLVVLAVQATRGIFQGAVKQLFALVGVVVGLWAALWLAQWVGHHWSGARPAVVFWALKWLVAALGGLAAATLLQFWGEALGEAVKTSVAGGFDRAAGLATGALSGLIAVTLVLLLALLMTWPRAVSETARTTRYAAPLMRAGARISSIRDSIFPGSHWLKNRFLDAERRARGSLSSS
jgi:uncharacterized membrane protein required for colicin V production